MPNPRKLSSALIVLLAAIMTGCDVKPPTEDFALWIRFAPPGGGFSVLMPSKPVELEEPGKPSTGLESRTFRIVAVLGHVAAMAVSYADRPNRPGVETDPAKILKAVADQAVSNLRGDLMEQKSISVQGNPGLELKIEINGGHFVRQRIYLVNKRLISIMVTAGSKGLTSPEAEYFFGSFKLQ